MQEERTKNKPPATTTATSQRPENGSVVRAARAHRRGHRATGFNKGERTASLPSPQNTLRSDTPNKRRPPTNERNENQWGQRNQHNTEDTKRQREASHEQHRTREIQIHTTRIKRRKTVASRHRRFFGCVWFRVEGVFTCGSRLCHLRRSSPRSYCPPCLQKKTANVSPRQTKAAFHPPDATVKNKILPSAP